MKKLVLVCIALITMGVMAVAQDGPRRFDPKQMAKWMTERMVEEYGLNKNQEAQLLKLNENQFSNPNLMRGPRRDEGQQLSEEERQKMMAEMEKARNEYNKQLQQILTKEQYEDYAKKEAERRERWGGGRNR
ncbi:MAG: DUF4890 domain-containing protein [Mediterranea massiliensis]|nr:DUF4890 domain-containing protein [Mediterranea massiliensis]